MIEYDSDDERKKIIEENKKKVEEGIKPECEVFWENKVIFLNYKL